MKNEDIISHWQYVKEVLDREIPEDISYSKNEYIAGVGFHYMTAMQHGVKHGKESDE